MFYNYVYLNCKISFRMNNSNNNSMNSIPKEFDYDDGVVCFGTVTEIQKERFKRLPRHTILPSDILLR